MPIKLIPFASILVLSATSAFSQTPPSASLDALKWTPYVQGAIASQRIISPSSTGTTVDLGASNKTTSFRGSVGLQLTPHFGIEGTWFQLPNNTVTANGTDATYSGSVFATSLTASVPLQPNISAVGRVGFGRSDVNVNVPSQNYNSDSRQNTIVWGLGLRYEIQKSLDLTIDFDNLGPIGKYESAGRVKAEMFSLGLKYSF